MELEFDKEIDVLLREAGNASVANSAAAPHLDADEFSSFAENALPQKTKDGYVRHLADCTACRKTLSQLILANTDAGSLAASAVSVKAAGETVVPWYRKLFLFPNLAYVLGSLVVVFAGFFGFELYNSTGPETAKITEVNQNVRPSGVDESGSADKKSEPTANSSNAAANIVSNAAAAKPASAANLAAGTNAVGMAMPKARVEEFQTDGASSAANEFRPEADNKKLEAPQPAEIAPNEDRSIAKSKASINARKAERPSDEEAKDLSTADQITAAPAPAAKAAGELVLSRVVSGKTFTNRGGVWIDNSYNGKPTLNIRRSSDDYRKLDSGLRSIIDRIGGTVIIAWKEKAYRIQ